MPQVDPIEPDEQFVTPELPEAEQLAEGLYNRQESLELKGQSIRVAIIGCGGVGCWAALAIALGGCPFMLLFDADELSLHNLNRLPFPAGLIGESKSVALANWLQLLRPELHVEARGMLDPELHADTLARCSWVVCCTDSLKSRKMAFEMASGLGSHYLELGADGERWTLSPKPPEFTTSLEAEAGYAVTPVHVGPCMMAGAAAAYYVLHNRRPEVGHLVEWQNRPDGDYAQLPLLHMITNPESERAIRILQPDFAAEPIVMLESTARGIGDFSVTNVGLEQDNGEV